jgi:hypothetical protein
MKRLAVTPILFCSLLALAVTACGDDGNDNEGMPDAMTPQPPDAMTPQPPDAAVPDAGPPPTPEIVVSATTLSVNEGSADGATITVKLSAAPGAALAVTLASSDEAAAAVAPTSLSFDASSFATEQTVTVTAADDADTSNETVTLTLSGTGLAEVTVEVTVVDDDVLNIRAEPTTLTLDEGATATFDVSLTVPPTGDVTVNVASGDEGAATVDATTLAFTPANFDEPQTVTVTAAADADTGNESVTVTLSADGIAEVTVTVTVTDTTQPFAVPMFVRFTEPAGLNADLVYQGNNRYRAVAALTAPVIANFKIADANQTAGTTFSASNTGPQTIELDTSTTLVQSNNQNHQTLLVITSQSGDYQFDLDATSNTSPVLTVTRVQ